VWTLNVGGKKKQRNKIVRFKVNSVKRNIKYYAYSFWNTIFRYTIPC